MTRPILFLALLATACTPATQQSALQSTPGQLVCWFQLAGGGEMVAKMVKDAVVPGSGAAAPVAILATDMGKAFVDKTCADAVASVAGARVGVPVSPPPGGAVATVAVKG